MSSTIGDTGAEEGDSILAVTKVDQWDLMKPNSNQYLLCSNGNYLSWTTQLKRRRQQSGRKIFANYTSDREIIFPVSKELKKLRNQITQLKNRQLIRTESSKKEKQKCLRNKFMCSRPLAIREMKTKSDLGYYLPQAP